MKKKEKKKKETNQISQDLNVEEKKYPSSYILLDATRSEYNFENERKRGIDSRTGVLLAFTGTILIYSLSNAGFKINPKCISWVQLIYLISEILLVFTVIIQVRLLNSKEYKRINCYNFNRNLATKNVDEMNMALIDSYLASIKIYHDINEKRVKIFNASLYSLMIAILLIAIYQWLK